MGPPGMLAAFQGGLHNIHLFFAFGIWYPRSQERVGKGWQSRDRRRAEQIWGGKSGDGEGAIEAFATRQS